MLPTQARERNFDVLCGASVGAINTSFLAATAHNMAYQGRETRRLWEDVREEDIYRRDRKALMSFLSKTGRGITGNLFRKTPQQGSHFNGFLDTTPFLPFIQKVIPWEMITKNVKAGLVKAVSIVTTNVFTGRMELFVEKAPEVEYTGEYLVHLERIMPIHVMASAAIPIVFPTVLINDVAYTDGGLRLNTPMSPAIQLGADTILVLGLHHHAKPGERVPFRGIKGRPAALGQVMGRVMNSIFLDRIQYDIEQLERINRIIDWGEMLYGSTFLKDMNDMLGKKRIRGDIANRGLKRIRVMRIRPSEDIGEIFAHCFRRGRDSHFSSFEKFLVRFLDIDPNSGNDLLSYLAFMPEYLKKLLELGFEDARSHHQELTDLLTD